MSTSSAPPRVSVVIASYNAGDYLIEAVKSVLGQTVHDLELIVVDDGSTDGSADALSGIGDPRLRVVRQENAGQTRAKNRGIEESCGEIIGFCDADDYWYPNKLELQLPLFDRSEKTGVVYSAAQKIDEHGVPIESTWATPHRGQVVSSLFMRNFVPFGTALVRRTCIEQVGPFNESFRMGIDWDLWLRVSTRFEFDFVEDYTYAYRIWSGQMSSNWRGRYDCAFRIMREFVDDNPGAISPELYRKARANTYANKARARVKETPLAAMTDSLLAVALDPTEQFNWRTVARVPLDAADSSVLQHARSDPEDRFFLAKRVGAPVARFATRGLPRIFTYHRFGSTADKQKMGDLEFREHLDYLAKKCVVLPLSEALDSGKSQYGRKPVVSLTIDDGYADFMEYAYPALRERNMVATVFVTTGFVERELYLWPDRIRAALFKIPSANYELGGYWEGTSFSTNTEKLRESAWHTIADRLVFKHDTERESAISDFFSEIGIVESDLDMSPYTALTWDDLRTLHAEGFEIGDHTWGHSYLPLLNERELQKQLDSSKQMIEQNIQSNVRSFAYPNGSMRDLTPSVLEHIRSTGYDHAVTSVQTRYCSENRFEIGRLPGHVGIRRFVGLVSGYGFLRAPKMHGRSRSGAGAGA